MIKINYGNKDVFKEFTKTLDESVKVTYGPILLRAVRGDNEAMFNGIGTPEFDRRMDSMLREHNERFNAEVIPQSLGPWGCLSRYAKEQEYLEMAYYDYMYKAYGIKSSAELMAHLKKVNPVQEMLSSGDVGAILAIRDAKLRLLGGTLTREELNNRVDGATQERLVQGLPEACLLERNRDLTLYKLARIAMSKVRQKGVNLHLVDEAKNPLDYELLVSGHQNEWELQE